MPNPDIQQLVKDCSNLSEIHQKLSIFFSNIKKHNPKIKIIYLAGKVTADGKNMIKKNLLRLKSFATEVKNIYPDDFIFSAADVFNDEVYWKINIPQPVHELDFYSFWRGVLSSGVTDVYMTPEWENSLGAKDEYETAKELSLIVHFM